MGLPEAFLFAAIKALIVGVVVWLVLWAVDYLNVPEPFNKIAKVLVVFGAVLFVIFLLLGLVR